MLEALPDFSSPGRKEPLDLEAGTDWTLVPNGSKLFKPIPKHFCPLDELGIMVLNGSQQN